MLVVTNEHDIVKGVYLIPGTDAVFPVHWHSYFPVSGPIPQAGQVFVPVKESGEWLFLDSDCTILREKDRVLKLKHVRDH